MSERFNGPYKMVPFEDWNCTPGQMAQVQQNIDGVDKETVWFVCPCGCGDNTRLTVNGSKNSIGDSWDFSVDEQGRPTLSPSVHAFQTCGAHYFITQGMVRWC